MRKRRPGGVFVCRGNAHGPPIFPSPVGAASAATVIASASLPSIRSAEASKLPRRSSKPRRWSSEPLQKSKKPRLLQLQAPRFRLKAPSLQLESSNAGAPGSTREAPSLDFRAHRVAICSSELHARDFELQPCSFELLSCGSTAASMTLCAHPAQLEAFPVRFEASLVQHVSLTFSANSPGSRGSNPRHRATRAPTPRQIAPALQRIAWRLNLLRSRFELSSLARAAICSAFAARESHLSG